MRKLIKYNLDRKKTFEYFHWNLEGLNALSVTVLENVSFDLGNFYTLMPDGLTEKQLYDFRGGCVKSYDIQEGVSKYIHDMQKTNHSYFCVFDDFTDEFSQDFYDDDDIFKACGVDYKHKEVYLILPNQESNTHKIQECLQMSDCIWHSLMVMTDTPFKRNEDRSISKEELQSIAKHAKLVVLRAYDQEGYVFWEKNTAN